jgi:hypothetical protein
LSIAEFESALDTYGGELRNWPAHLRADAALLLTSSITARGLFEAARAVEEALAAPAAPAPSGLADRIVDKALGTPRK